MQYGSITLKFAVIAGFSTSCSDRKASTEARPGCRLASTVIHLKTYVQGLATAKAVKFFVEEQIYLKFQPFQEIVISQGGRAEQLEVSEFILELAEGG
jgi:hypothetical protein